MSDMKTIRVDSPSGLETAARQILESFPDHKIFAFHGEMGAGKTTLIRAFCRLLGVAEEVSSPTFALVNEYAAGHGPVYHFDFYRIEDISEVFDIGYEDYFYSGEYCLLEWPEKITELLPENFVYLRIKITGEQQRMISYHSV